jgi:hypothetical protein
MLQRASTTAIQVRFKYKIYFWIDRFWVCLATLCQLKLLCGVQHDFKMTMRKNLQETEGTSDRTASN